MLTPTKNNFLLLCALISVCFGEPSFGAEPAAEKQETPANIQDSWKLFKEAKEKALEELEAQAAHKKIAIHIFKRTGDPVMREEAAILEKALEEIEKQSATLLNELKNLEDAPHKIVVKIKMLKKEQESYLNQFEKANRDKKEISKQIAHKQTQIDQITENKDKKESETQVAVLQAEIAALQAKLSFITRRFDDSAKEAQVIQDKINGFTQLLKNFQELESVQE